MPRLRWLSFHLALLYALWLGLALKSGEGSGLLFLLALAVIAISYLPVLSRLAEGGPAPDGL